VPRIRKIVDAFFCQQDLSSFYEKNAPCAGGIFLDADERLWGVVKHNGRYWDSGWPDFAKNLFEAGRRYLATLQHTHFNGKTDNSVLRTDTAALVRLLKVDKGLREIDFLAQPTDLEKLPLELLQARLAFLQELGFVGEQTRTKSAILMAQ